jgi:hypothetical protein
MPVTDGRATGGGAPPLGGVTFRAALENLRGALADADLSTASEALAAARHAGVPSAAAAALERVEALVGDYEFDAAGAAVAELLSAGGGGNDA